MVFKQYTYGSTSASLPVSESFCPVNYDELVRVAGFDPNDEEIVVCELEEDWNGHKVGALVVTGMMVAGHKFAVQSNNGYFHVDSD